MTESLAGKKVLILVSNGVDEAAMSTVQRELLKVGAIVKTVGAAPGLVNSWGDNAWGLYFPVDLPVSQALGADFDFLVVPSGARSVKKLAENPHTERIIGSFIAAKKPMYFMGDAEELVTRTGTSGSHILTGNCLQGMIAHFSGPTVTPLAA
jgi:protease I